MSTKNVKYIVVNKEGKKEYPIHHNTILVPRMGETIKDERGTYIVRNVIHEGLFADPSEHIITVVIEEA